MPIYEYECLKCGDTFEVMHSISADPLKKHGENGCKGKVQRLVSASGFILKGEGWYTSDYPSEARKKGWEEESKGAKTASEAPKAESTPDSTPSNKAEPAPKAPEKPAKPPGPKSPYTSGAKKKNKSAAKPSS